MALTPKQEKFCQCIVSGMSGKDSYKTAYDTNASEQVIYNEANKLLQRDDITKRIDELRKPLENHARNMALSETERIKQILWEEIENARTQQDHAAVARYADQLNKLNGAYKDNSTVENDNTLDGMDTSKLLKLVGTA